MQCWQSAYWTETWGCNTGRKHKHRIIMCLCVSNVTTSAAFFRWQKQFHDTKNKKRASVFIFSESDTSGMWTLNSANTFCYPLREHDPFHCGEWWSMTLSSDFTLSYGWHMKNNCNIVSCVSKWPFYFAADAVNTWAHTTLKFRLLADGNHNVLLFVLFYEEKKKPEAQLAASGLQLSLYPIKIKNILLNFAILGT